MDLIRCAQCAKDNPPQFVTVHEAAQFLRVSAMTVYRLIDSGDLKSVRIGRNIRIHVADLDDYLKHLAA